MKKLIAITILAFVALAGFSTVRTIKSDKLLKADVTSPHSVTWSYTGVAADTLTANQDTLIYNITLNKAEPFNYYIKIGLDTIAGADTTVVVNINGRMFDDEDWTLIETTTSSEIASAADVTIESVTDADFYFPAYNVPFTNPTAGTADTLEYPILTPVVSINPFYRQIQVEIIISGEDFTGSGIKLTDIQWYFAKSLR